MPAHAAALLPSPSIHRLTLTTLPTPTPGPGEVLVRVRCLALNPVDAIQRDTGFPPVASYPTVLGSDVSGIVIAHGPDIPATAPRKGERVLASATGFYHQNKREYGAFQEYVLARWEGVVRVPDTMSFEQGAVCPLGAFAAASGFRVLGCFPPAVADLPDRLSHGKSGERNGVLIWGASSRVGSFSVQFARRLGFRVYATASPKHHLYVQGLGAPDVVAQIVDAVGADGVRLVDAQAIVPGSLGPVLDVLEKTLEMEGKTTRGKVGHAAPLLPGHAQLEGVDVRFSEAPADSEARNEFIRVVFQELLKPGLEDGSVIASPHVRVIEGGLERLNDALDILREGVSGTKLVVRVHA